MQDNVLQRGTRLASAGDELCRSVVGGSRPKDIAGDEAVQQQVYVDVAAYRSLAAPVDYKVSPGRFKLGLS